MSCPYFYPTQSRAGSALLPLGDRWVGVCHTDPAAPVEPDDTKCCNLGYARGECSRFPDTDGPDAVRFTIAGADESGVQLYYVMERDHHPFAHGPLAYSFANGFGPSAGPLLQRQAQAYVESYQKRKGA